MQRIVSLVVFGLALCQASDKISSIPNLDPAMQCWDSYSGYLPVEVTRHASCLCHSHLTSNRAQPPTQQLSILHRSLWRLHLLFFQTTYTTSRTACTSPPCLLVGSVRLALNLTSRACVAPCSAAIFCRSLHLPALACATPVLTC